MAPYQLLYVNSSSLEKCVMLLLRGKQWDVKKRGGMEGTVYAAPVFLGLIPLSRGAISVFWLCPKFPVVYASFAKPHGSLWRITSVMPVWQGCKLPSGPGDITTAGGTKKNASASACLHFPPSLCPSLCKHLLSWWLCWRVPLIPLWCSWALCLQGKCRPVQSQLRMKLIYPENKKTYSSYV